MEYMSVTEAAEKWGLSRKRVQVLCVSERIPGSMRVGKYWAIPSGADKPADRRSKDTSATSAHTSLLS